MLLQVILLLSLIYSIDFSNAQETKELWKKIKATDKQLVLIRIRICDNNTIDGQTSLPLDVIEKLNACEQLLDVEKLLANPKEIKQCFDQTFPDPNSAREKFVAHFCDLRPPIYDFQNPNIIKVFKCVAKLVGSKPLFKHHSVNSEEVLEIKNKALGCFKEALKIGSDVDIIKHFSADYLKTKRDLQRKLICSPASVCTFGPNSKMEEHPKYEQELKAMGKCYEQQPTLNHPNSTVKLTIMINPKYFCGFFSLYKMYTPNFWTRHRTGFGSITKQQFFEKHSGEIEKLTKCQREALANNDEMNKKFEKCIEKWKKFDGDS